MTDPVGKIGFNYSTDLMKQTKTRYSGGGVAVFLQNSCINVKYSYLASLTLIG